MSPSLLLRKEPSRPQLLQEKLERQDLDSVVGDPALSLLTDDHSPETRELLGEKAQPFQVSRPHLLFGFHFDGQMVSYHKVNLNLSVGSPKR